MSEIHPGSVAEEVFFLLPLFQERLLKPFEQLAKHSISPVQFQVMLQLLEHRQLTMTEIAQKIHVSKQQTTQLIDRLIAGGYVARSTNEKDRRAIPVLLTPVGLAFLEQHRLEMINLLKSKLMALDPEDLATLSDSARSITTIVRKLP